MILLLIASWLLLIVAAVAGRSYLKLYDSAVEELKMRHKYENKDFSAAIMAAEKRLNIYLYSYLIGFIILLSGNGYFVYSVIFEDVPAGAIGYLYEDGKLKSTTEGPAIVFNGLNDIVVWHNTIEINTKGYKVLFELPKDKVALIGAFGTERALVDKFLLPATITAIETKYPEGPLNENKWGIKTISVAQPHGR